MALHCCLQHLGQFVFLVLQLQTLFLDLRLEVPDLLVLLLLPLRDQFVQTLKLVDLHLFLHDHLPVVFDLLFILVAVVRLASFPLTLLLQNLLNNRLQPQSLALQLWILSLQVAGFLIGQMQSQLRRRVLGLWILIVHALSYLLNAFCWVLCRVLPLLSRFPLILDLLTCCFLLCLQFVRTISTCCFLLCLEFIEKIVSFLLRIQLTPVFSHIIQIFNWWVLFPPLLSLLREFLINLRNRAVFKLFPIWSHRNTTLVNWEEEVSLVFTSASLLPLL